MSINLLEREAKLRTSTIAKIKIRCTYFLHFSAAYRLQEPVRKEHKNRHTTSDYLFGKSSTFSRLLNSTIQESNSYLKSDQASKSPYFKSRAFFPLIDDV